MADHPTRDAIDAYARGTLPPAELIAVDDHVASCGSCRALVEIDLTTASLTWPLAIGHEHVAEHPVYEQWEALVDGTLDDVDRELLQTHLSDCSSCAAEVADLRHFKARLSMTDPAVSPPVERSLLAWLSGLLASPVFRVAMPAGAVAVAALIWTLVPDRGAPPVSNVIATDRRAAPATAPASVPPTVVGELPIIVARVDDTSGPVTLDADGVLHGMPPLADGERTTLARALRDGQLPFPASMRDVITRRGTLLGPGDTPEPFSVVAPLATAVESDQPEFSWKAQPGATAYTVIVYDDEFSRAAESPTVTGLSWRPAAPLRRGRIYSWQLRATTPQGAVTSPRPPAAEARFAVIAAADAERIVRLRADVRAGGPGSRLRLAVAFAQTGMLDDAERQLQALQQANAGSTVVSTMLDGLRDFRR